MKSIHAQELLKWEAKMKNASNELKNLHSQEIIKFQTEIQDLGKKQIELVNLHASEIDGLKLNFKNQELKF